MTALDPGDFAHDDELRHADDEPHDPPCYCPGPLVVARGQHLESCERRTRRRVTAGQAAVRDAEIQESYEDEVRAAALARRERER